MGIIKKALHSKIDVVVKFESAINLEIRGQIKKKLDSFYLDHRDHMYAFSSKSGSEPFRALGDLTWNGPFHGFASKNNLSSKQYSCHSSKNIISISKLGLDHCTPFCFHASGFFSKHKF